MFLEKADAEIIKYESAELIVAARIPDITIPATIGTKKLVDLRMKMFSAALWVRKASGNMTLPMIPMAMDAPREMAHQRVAILLDKVSSEVSRMAINFRSTWGMPKYPNPRTK